MLLSLFCGPGGLDLGFKREGFETGLAFDINQDSVNTYNLNHPNQPAYVRDIRELTIKDIDALYGRAFMPFGVIGGPPCQSFSIANVFQKEDDPRHELLTVYARLIADLNRRYPVHFFVFENVTGLKTKYKEKYVDLKNKFEKAGFTVFDTVVNAINYGVPQDRPRIIVVGINSKIYPAIEWIPPEPTANLRTVRDAIEGLPEPVFFKKNLAKEDIPYHPNHWCMNPKSKKFSTPGALIAGKTIGRSFRSLAWDKPSYTVAYGNREVHVHPSCKRRLSVYEAMLLQGFPHQYELSGSLSSQIKQVSDAVPPPLAQEIACSIKKLLRI